MNIDNAPIIKRRIDQGIEFLEHLKSEIERAQREYESLNTEMPRKHIAQMLGVDPSTVYRMRERGELRSYKMKDVLRYMKSNQ